MFPENGSSGGFRGTLAAHVVNCLSGDRPANPRHGFERRKGIVDAKEIGELTGSDIIYRYQELPQRCSDAEIRHYVERTRDLFGPVAARIHRCHNTEWFIRSYLALKFVLGATVLGNSAEYGKAHNIQVMQPYLSYYTMLNCARSFLLTLPCVDWRSEKTIEMTHSNIITTTSERLRRLGKGHEEKVGRLLRVAKDQRELFSYRFPSMGLSIFGKDLIPVEEAIATARMLTELAQINLAILEAHVAKYQPDVVFCVLEQDDMWHTMEYEAKTESFIDDDDYRRVEYFVRKFRGRRRLCRWPPTASWTISSVLGSQTTM